MANGKGMRATLQRRLLLVGMIPRYPRKVTAPELVQRLPGRGIKTSLRTVERDLEALSGFMPLVCDEDSRPYGWSWMKDAPLQDMPTLDPETALILQVLDAHGARLLPPAARAHLEPQIRRATEVLESGCEDSGMRLWPERVRILSAGPPLRPPNLPNGIFSLVQQALLERRCLDITYESRARGGQRKDYRIHPLALVFREPITYLIATIEPHQDALQLAVHRILQASISSDSARDPDAGFDLESLIQSGAFDYPEGDWISLELRLTQELAYHLREATLSDDQQLELGADGLFRLRATVRDTARLRWWLLGLGSGIEVIGPQSLRLEISSELTKMSLLYESAG